MMNIDDKDTAIDHLLDSAIASRRSGKTAAEVEAQVKSDDNFKKLSPAQQEEFIQMVRVATILHKPQQNGPQPT